MKQDIAIFGFLLSLVALALVFLGFIMFGPRKVVVFPKIDYNLTLLDDSVDYSNPQIKLSSIENGVSFDIKIRSEVQSEDDVRVIREGNYITIRIVDMKYYTQEPKNNYQIKGEILNLEKGQYNLKVNDRSDSTVGTAQFSVN